MCNVNNFLIATACDGGEGSSRRCTDIDMHLIIPITAAANAANAAGPIAFDGGASDEATTHCRRGWEQGHHHHRHRHRIFCEAGREAMRVTNDAARGRR